VYNPQTAEEALSPSASPIFVYSTSKALADLAVRDYKRAERDLDFDYHPPILRLWPLGRGQVYNAPSTGPNWFIYALINDHPVSGYDPAVRTTPLSVDVRDVSRAHVLALEVPPSDQVKRFIIPSSMYTWVEAVKFLAQARPELKGRLPIITGNEPPMKLFATLDTSATESVLGLKDYIKWQDMTLDTVDDLL
jgi:nucleoside-diphosphate-sugar epimerase